MERDKDIIESVMEKALVTAGILIVPTITMIIGLRLSGRNVEWIPLSWAGFAFSVYFLLLRSEGVIPTPLFVEDLDLNWFGKTMTLVGTITMLYFLPSAGFRVAGLTWRQNRGSLSQVGIDRGHHPACHHWHSHAFHINPQYLFGESFVPGNHARP